MLVSHETKMDRHTLTQQVISVEKGKTIDSVTCFAILPFGSLFDECVCLRLQYIYMTSLVDLPVNNLVVILSIHELLLASSLAEVSWV